MKKTIMVKAYNRKSGKATSDYMHDIDDPNHKQTRILEEFSFCSAAVKRSGWDIVDKWEESHQQKGRNIRGAKELEVALPRNLFDINGNCDPETARRINEELYNSICESGGLDHKKAMVEITWHYNYPKYKNGQIQRENPHAHILYSERELETEPEVKRRKQDRYINHKGMVCKKTDPTAQLLWKKGDIVRDKNTGEPVYETGARFSSKRTELDSKRALNHIKTRICDLYQELDPENEWSIKHAELLPKMKYTPKQERTQPELTNEMKRYNDIIDVVNEEYPHMENDPTTHHIQKQLSQKKTIEEKVEYLQETNDQLEQFLEDIRERLEQEKQLQREEEPEQEEEPEEEYSRQYDRGDYGLF